MLIEHLSICGILSNDMLVKLFLLLLELGYVNNFLFLCHHIVAVRSMTFKVLTVLLGL